MGSFGTFKCIIERGVRTMNVTKKHCYVCHLYYKEGMFFIEQYKPHPRKPYRIITYDFESQQIPYENTKKLHVVNFICAKIICTKCIVDGSWQQSLTEPCDICGSYRTRTWAPFKISDRHTDYHKQTTKPLSDFTSWLLNAAEEDDEELDPHYPSICFAHFGGRYDCTMLFGEFIKLGLNPYLVRQGNKLYEMTVEKTETSPELIFRDSYNYVSQPLNSLVKDLPVVPKMFFPHMYNLEKNYNTTLPHLPLKDDYLYKSKKPKDKEAFEKWYDEHYNEGFNFNEVIAEYCVNDVEILSHALVALRKTFFQITKRPGCHGGVDILNEAMTIASACMRAFRLNHLRPNHLAIVPEKGYDAQQNHSLVALKFLAWYAKEHDVTIQTVQSDEGEKRVGSRKVHFDGYVKEQNKGIEVHGCYYHGCLKCFPLDQTKLADGKTAGLLRKENEKRLEYILQYHDVEVYYECEIYEMLKQNDNMKKFFDAYEDVGPINFRDCFFGGRTGPMKLYHEAKPGQKISYKDFTSLYPYTNFITEYPVGHPKVKVIKRGNQDVNWSKAADNPHRGILKVLVVPPQNITVPVLPIRLDNDERLLFTLCKKCALLYLDKRIIHAPTRKKNDNSSLHVPILN